MEDFSKLSIRNKSTTVSQTMHWIIPQLRLNQHCPFLEKEYPYFTTEFSILHPSYTVEMKWRLEMERNNDKVSVNILNVNEKELFDKKELMNVLVRWNLRLKSGQDDGPMGILSEQMFHQRENMEVNRLQFFKDSQSEGRSVCDLESFDSFAIDGKFIVEVKMELEYFQFEEQKSSFLDLSKRFSASLSESTEYIYSKISSHQRDSVSDASGVSAPCHSWIPGHHASFASSKPGYGQTQEKVLPAFQQQPVHYQYQRPSSTQFGCHSLRRSRSGRTSDFSTTSGASSSYSTSTLDRVSRARHLSGHFDEGFDNYQTYSYIPDYLFSEAAHNSSTADEVFHHQPPGSIYPHNSHPNTEKVYHYNSPSNIPTQTKVHPYQSPLLKKSLDRNPSFQAQFSSNADHGSSLSVSDSSVSSASSSLISCIYTAKLPEQAVILKDRRKLLEMGIKYNLLTLVKECERSYLLTLKVQNCLETLLVVDNFLPKSELKQTVINFMKVNLKEVMMEPNWGKFVENCDDLVNEIWAVEIEQQEVHC